ncbi:MAG: nuclear transport factor 2 family protein [Pseudomonadota bacterium]|nr:nuclear transport factor 2 family protein [Pseudomonadota bacterium]
MEVDVQEYEKFHAWKEDQARQQHNISTVRAVLAAEGEANTEAFFASFSDDCVFWMNGNSPASGPRQGLPALKAHFEIFMSLLVSGISMTVTNAVASGDWVVTETVGHANTRTGRSYNGTYCQLWKFKNSQIVEFREYLDTQLLGESFDFK